MVRDIVTDTYILEREAIPAKPSDKRIALDLLDTLKAHSEECVGMAANMIGIPKAIIVVNLGMMDMVMFNPVITKKKGEYKAEEGCLSLLGRREAVRYKEIDVEFQDMDFKKQKLHFSGFAAQIIQHEVDHLHGILI